MARVDETSYGAHDFTVDWWRQLPEEFRKADRAQGEALAPAWDGLNRDPRFVTGFDGWDRANTSTKPWEASLALSRSFEVTPGVPVLVRSWHTPRHTGTGELDAVGVVHTIRDYRGQVVKTTKNTVTAEQGTVDTWITPDRFGRIHVTVQVTLAVPYSMDALNAVHVGTRQVTFEELPDLTAFTVHKPYPLLRYMDGVGHLAGYMRTEARHMWHGHTTNPVTAPDAWLPFLAAMLGLPQTYTARLSAAQLRSHLVAFVEQGRPPIGSRRAIAEVAKQWLYGDKQVTVTPANSMPSWPTPEDKALLTAVTGNGDHGRVLVSPTPPVPQAEYRWLGEPNQSVTQLLVNGRLAAENRVPNPGFHEGINGWTGTRATIERDTTRYETGVASMKITPTATNWYTLTGYLQQPSYSYVRLRFRVYSEVERKVHAKMWLYDPATSRTAPSVTIPAGQWTTVEGRFLVERGREHRYAIAPAASEASLEPLWVDRVYAAREAWMVDGEFDGNTPDSIANDVWIRPGTPNTVHVWDPAERWVVSEGDHQVAAQAVIDANTRGDRTHTLLMLVRTDELPRRDLASFQEFMEGTGVIPAGHRLVCLEAKTTWDQWEATVGTTWADLEARVRAWTHDEAAGVALDF